MRDQLAVDRKRDALDAYAMVFESPLVPRIDGVFEYAAESFTPQRPVLEAVRELVARIFKEFTYDARATEVSTPLAEVLELKRGVCQDFAHLAIACLRSHGLPEAAAQRLVIEGFLQALVERLEEGPVREAVGAAVERRLAAVLDN